MARKISKNQSKAASKNANKKNKNQVPEAENKIEDITVNPEIKTEPLTTAAAKPTRKSTKKAIPTEHGETKEQLMQRVRHELIKTFITAAVSMAAGIILAEFITLY